MSREVTEPHVLQRHALHELHTHLGVQGRGVVVMPCGSGKTLLGRWFAEQTAARVTVVFVPSLALQASGVVADLMVCDEAHRLAGRPRAEFRAVLDEQAMPARRRMFLTATPVEAAAWASELDDDELVTAPLALDDEQLFGPTIYRATFEQAIAAGRLVDYDVEVLAVRPGTGDIDEQPGATHAVLTAVAAGSRRVLTFHSRVSSARRLAEELDGRCVDGGGIEGVHLRAEHLEARHGAHRRGAALARLAEPGPGYAALLASARILTEGVDVPAVDTVVFAEPRTSAVDIVQAVGRAMRLSPGKTRGRIVLAVTTGGVDVDEDTELAGSAWRHVWITLRALASMDPRFAARLRTQPTGPHGPTGTPRPGVGPGLEVNLPDGLDADRWMLRALDRTGTSWWACYDLLVAHAREYGAARPSSFAETPYWARCTTCSEYFEDGDQGLITPTIGDVDPDYLIGTGTRVTLTGQHRECALSSVAGHIVGVCSCTGWDTSARATSLEVQRRVDVGGLRPELPAEDQWDDPVLYEHWSLPSQPIDTVRTTGDRL